MRRSWCRVVPWLKSAPSAPYLSDTSLFFARDGSGRRVAPGHPQPGVAFGRHAPISDVRINRLEPDARNLCDGLPIDQYTGTSIWRPEPWMNLTTPNASPFRVNPEVTLMCRISGCIT
jgi:hypothetical protein